MSSSEMPARFSKGAIGTLCLRRTAIACRAANPVAEGKMRLVGSSVKIIARDAQPPIGQRSVDRRVTALQSLRDPPSCLAWEREAESAGPKKFGPATTLRQTNKHGEGPIAVPERSVHWG